MDISLSDISQASKRISELDRVSSLLSDDYFIIEDGTTSYKVKYANFLCAFVDHLSTIVGFNTGAYSDADEYARFAHGHPYSDFGFFPSYGP